MDFGLILDSFLGLWDNVSSKCFIPSFPTLSPGISPTPTDTLSGQTSMVKVTLELGQRRLGNRWGNVLLDAWAGLNVAYPLMGLRGTRLT